MSAHEPPSHAGARATLESLLADAGGVSAPRERFAGLRAGLLDELELGARQLALTRSGYGRPVVVALVVAPANLLLAVAPVDQALRSDAGAVGERSWLLVAALVGAMVEAVAASAPGVLGAPATGPAGASRPTGAPGASGAPGLRPAGAPGAPTATGPSTTRRPGPLALELRAGALGRWLALALPLTGDGEAAELAVLAFEEQSAGIDRLRARAHALPPNLLDGVTDLRPPIGEDHPLRAAETVARLGGRPADEASMAEHEDAVLAVLGSGADAARPHAERDPALRVARRILQRLAGMGKWGGYHTDFAHLARGFAGNDRALATAVGERLLAAGLLLSKPSVGQRHVYLNPRRAGDIHALIERGEAPLGLELPEG